MKFTKYNGCYRCVYELCLMYIVMMENEINGFEICSLLSRLKILDWMILR